MKIATDDRTYVSLSEPSRATTIAMTELCRALAHDLDTEALGGEGSGEWIKDAADDFYNHIFDAACEVEVLTPTAQSEDAELEARVTQDRVRGEMARGLL
jgi:hypothetical protein